MLRRLNNVIDPVARLQARNEIVSQSITIKNFNNVTNYSIGAHGESNILIMNSNTLADNTRRRGPREPVTVENHTRVSDRSYNGCGFSRVEIQNANNHDDNPQRVEVQNANNHGDNSPHMGLDKDEQDFELPNVNLPPYEAYQLNDLLEGDDRSAGPQQSANDNDPAESQQIADGNNGHAVIGRLIPRPIFFQQCRRLARMAFEISVSHPLLLQLWVMIGCSVMLVALRLLLSSYTAHTSMGAHGSSPTAMDANNHPIFQYPHHLSSPDDAAEAASVTQNKGVTTMSMLLPRGDEEEEGEGFCRLYEPSLMALDIKWSFDRVIGLRAGKAVSGSTVK
ncbi:MAG: hypothetical protein Q9159_007411 [Coniocarpon cinnabarinum]